MRKRKKVRKEIEEKKLLIRQLEGVYRTSSDVSQKKRVLKEIRDIRISIKDLGTVLALREHLGKSEWGEEIEEAEGFSILSSIKVHKFRKESKDKEIDAVISYMEFFEKNYLPILSEYYIKLDFNHSMKRDTYYTRFMEMKKILKEYDYEVEIHSKKEYNAIAYYKDKSIVFKIRQRYLLALDKYFKDLQSFVKALMDDHITGGAMVSNPLDCIGLSEFEEDRRLDGYTVIDALVETYTFSVEFTRFLGIPRM